MCYVDGYIWKVRLGGQTDLKPPQFGENLRALSEASVNPTIVVRTTVVKLWVSMVTSHF